MTKTKISLLSVVTIFVMLAFFCLTACTQKFDYTAGFSQEQVTLEKGQEFNPRDYIEIGDGVSFTSSSQSVLSQTEQQTFVANQSGRAVVSAYDGDIFIDSLQVYVKYQFLTPTNLKMTNDGVLSWDRSDVSVDGKNIAPVYEVKIVEQGEETFVESHTNSFAFDKAGTFTVSVRAQQTDLVSASDFSSEATFYFDLTQGATNFVVESDKTFGSQQATISWNGSQSGYLTIDGITQHVSSTSISHDFSRFEEGERIDVDLVLSSPFGLSKTLSQTIKKLTTPQISVSTNSLSWQRETGAEKYILKISSPASDISKEVETRQTFSTLEGLGEGVYTITYQAIASAGYLNGEVKSVDQLVGKVKNVDAQIEIEGDSAKITFSTDSVYSRRFVVKQNSMTFTFEFDNQLQDGKYVMTQTFKLQEGDNVFSVQALPTLDDGEFKYQNFTTTYAIGSDEKVFCNAIKVPQTTGLSHSIDENGSSILQFDSNSFANDYQVKINQIAVEDAVVDIGDETTTINLGKITKAKYGQTQSFEIELLATRLPQQEEAVAPSQTTKTLTMLSAPSMNGLNGSRLGQNSYTWRAVDGAKYVFSLFTTDESFVTDEVQPQTDVVLQNSVQDLVAGYYVLQVQSWPLDENNFLPSEEIGSDYFYYAQQLASAPIRIDYVDDVASLVENSGFVLSIQTVEFAYGYTIKVDGVEVGKVFNDLGEQQLLTFNFPADYDFSQNAKSYNITVEAFAENQAQQQIHPSSQSSLVVNKMAMPQDVEVEDGSQIASVKNLDKQATITIQKDGEDVVTGESGQDAKISVKQHDGDFSIRAKVNGYYEFEGFTTNGVVNLDSDFATFMFHRSQTPTMLNYSNQTLSFSHADKATAYHVDITVSSANGSTTRAFETSLLSFNLEEEIAELREGDEVFNSYFTQKTQITLRVYADINLSQDGIYYLPSRYATLKYDPASTELVISKLDKVMLSYDEETQIISWEGVSQQNPEYLVYLGEELQQTISAPSQSGRYEFSVSDYDFLQPGDYNFYVIARSDNSLQADASAAIIFHKISPVSKLRVFRQGDEYFADFNIGSADVNYITDITVNGKSIGIKNQFKLDADEFSIVLKGSSFNQDGNQIFFISSTPSAFTIKQAQISTYQPNTKISNGTLSWDDFSPYVSDWALVGRSDNLRNEVVIYNQAKEVVRTISGIQTNSLKLDEQQLINLVNGDYTASVFAYFAEYEISSQGKGYWGITQLVSEQSVKKLESVSLLQASIDSETSTIDNELQKTLKLQWQFDGTFTSQVTFEIYVNNVLAATTQQTSYELQQQLFDQQQNKVSVVATSSTDVKSDEVSINVGKFNELQVSVDDRGVLTIVDDSAQAAEQGYIVEITIKQDGGDYVQTAVITQTSQSIQSLINDHSGAATIRVTHKATQEVCLPNPAVATTNTRVLAQPQIVQDAEGLTLSSSDEDVVFYLQCEEKQFSTQLSGNYFAFPDDWQSGDYTIIVHAQKQGCIDSWTGDSAKTLINIDRIQNVSQVVFDRDESYLDHTLSWDAIDKAAGYRISVTKNSSLVGSQETDQTSIKLSQLFTLDGEGGEYIITFKTLADYAANKQTSSHIFEFIISVRANSISDIRAEDGLLRFDALSTGAGFYLSIKDAKGQQHENLPAVLDPDQNSYYVEGLTGQLQIVLRELATAQSSQTATAASTIYIDAATQQQAIYKLQDLKSISVDPETGYLYVLTDYETGSRKFYVTYVDEENNSQTLRISFSEVSQGRYRVRAIDLCRQFALKDGQEFKFTIYSVIDGNLKSDNAEFSFIYRKSNQTVVQEKLSETQDYVVIKDNGSGQVNENVTAIILRVLEGGSWKYHTINVDDAKGYWITHTFEQGGQSVVEHSFSLTPIEDEGYQSTPCYAIWVTDLLKNTNAGSFELQVGYITQTQEHYFIANDYNQSFEYKKLNGPTNFTIDQGNLVWRNAEGEHTGFVISFENQGDELQIFSSSSDATYFMGEDIPYSGEFEVALQAVSYQVGVLPSNKLYYEQNNVRQKVRKLQEIDTALTISNGVMSLSFDDERELPAKDEETSAEEYIQQLDSLERRLQTYSNGDLWTGSTFLTRLFDDILKYPFDYKIEELENVRFNLKFVNTQTQQEYITSVSALYLLSRLSESTLTALDSYIKTLGNVPERGRLQTFYNLLTNTHYFTGVATESLLFDEMGSSGTYGKVSTNNIPAGEYNIYIQQKGELSTNTISSAFTLKLSNISILPSLQVRTGSQSTAGEASKYYIKFMPSKNAQGEYYKNYTLVLKDKNLEEGETYHQIAKYDITFDGQTWQRTSFDGENKVLQTDEDGFVYISINGTDSGIIYENNIKDIYGKAMQLEGNDFAANIFINGTNTSLNGKTEEVSVVFLQFNINTLTLENGKFSWENFTVSGKTYSTTVAYQHSTNQQVQEMPMSGQRPTLSLTSTGAYNYISFRTQGTASNFAITVDSPLYTIRNVYKLNSPNVSVTDGKFSITDTNASFTVREFLISNNVYQQISRGEMYAQSTQGAKSIIYQTGVNLISSSQSDRYELGLSESEASMFYFATAGDSFEVTNSSLTGDDRDGYIININSDGGYIYLQSDTVSTPAAKLEMSSTISISNGNVMWKTAEPFGSFDIDTNNFAIVYEVKVEYYYQTAGDAWEISSQHTQTLYTTQNSLSASNIIDPNSDEFRYKIIVKAHIYQPSQTGSIVSLQGDRYQTVNNVQYFNNQTYILEGETYSSRLFERAQKVEDFKLSGGKITWTYSAGTTTGEGENPQNETTFIVYIAEGTQKTQLEGSWELNGDTYTFTLSQNKQQLQDDLLYNFAIVARQNNKITSNVVYMFDSAQARILPVLTEEDFATDQVGEQNGGTLNTVDFLSYFKKVPLSNKNLISLQVSAQISATQTYECTISYTQHILYIQIGGTDTGRENTVVLPELSQGVNVVVLPVPTADSSTPLLSAYKPTTLQLSYADWSDTDMVYFDEQAQTFYWTYGVKFADRTNGETQIFKDDQGGIYGFEEGQTLPLESIVLQQESYIPIMYTSQGQYQTYYVEIAGTYSQIRDKEDEEGGQEYLIFTTQEKPMMQLQDGKLVDSTFVMQAGIGYGYGGGNWAVKAKMPFDEEEQTYFVPQNLISYQTDEEGVVQFTVLQTTPWYVDQQTKQMPLLDDKVILNMASAYNPSLAYQEVIIGGEHVFIATENVYHYLTQDENFNENISSVHFKVSITTEYSYIEDRYTYEVVDERAYNNVPRGEKQTHFLDYNIDEEGIYVSSFQPNLIGEITQFSVQARKSQNNLLSQPLTCKQEQNISFSLFDLGDGSASNPYRIANETHFANMQYRVEKQPYHLTYNQRKTIMQRDNYNGTTKPVKTPTEFTPVVETDSVYKFQQTASLDFDIDGFVISQPFAGSYDGNGFSITANITSLAELDEAVETLVASSTGTQTTTFNYGASLFKEIASGGTLENVDVAFNFAFTKDMATVLASDGALVSGLVFENNGTIQNVAVISSNVSFESAIGAAATVAASPIIAFNRQEARELSSDVLVNITNTFTSGAQNFMYGGLVAFNDSANAKLLLSTNNGAINVNFKRNQNGVVMAGGIAISNVNATIEMTINNGAVNAMSRSGIAYAGGIAIHSTRGSFYHNANTANISASNAGGILYSALGTLSTGTVAMGRVNGAVDNLFAATATYASGSGTNYTYSSYSPSLGLRYEKIEASKNINCRSSDYILQVTYNNVNSYSVQIIEN